MKISVIIPVYNSETFLPMVFDSIENQTFKDFEVIFIEDSSSDNSLSLLKEFCSKNDYATVYSIENKGVSNARNVGIEKSKGEYIVFWDSDDKIEYNFLEVMEKYASEDYLAICGYYDNKNDQNKLWVYSDLEAEKLSLNAIKDVQDKRLFNIPWNKIFSAKVIKDNGILFDTSLSLGEDCLFNADYTQYQKGFIVVNQPLYTYYTRNTNASSRFHENQFISRVKGNLAILKFADKTQPDYDYTIWRIKHCFGEELIGSLWYYCKYYRKENKKIIKEILKYYKTSKNVVKPKVNLLLKITIGLGFVPLVRLYHKLILKGKQ